MRKQSCETAKFSEPRHIGDVIPEASMERVLAIAGEIQTELDSLQICPAPCEDGMVEVSPPSGQSQRTRCPLLSEFCPYGSGLSRKLDSFLDKLALDAGVPARHIENFGAYIETPALVWANQWRFKGFLVLSGGSGVGKSFGAAGAFKEFLRSKILNPLDADTWNRAMYAGERATWSTANKIIQDKNRIDESRKKWLLVLDDLGREGDSPTRRADVSDILAARYDAKLPTLVTTELSFSGIMKAYGRHTAYKLVEDSNGSGGMFVDCGNFSLRQEIDEIGELLR
jgi:hypothetical protein